jgi:hypothetical protein
MLDVSSGCAASVSASAEGAHQEVPTKINCSLTFTHDCLPVMQVDFDILFFFRKFLTVGL